MRRGLSFFVYFCCMIIYNETVIIEEASHLNWLSWMKDVQIPGIMATGLFTHHRILTVMDSPNEGVTYCVQSKLFFLCILMDLPMNSSGYLKIS
jgi:hypothetical protein